jgi:single-strand DNA-binding protein
MDISGKVKKVFDEMRFDSGFNKREFVITTEEQYPQDIKFETIKDRTSMLNGMAPGDKVKVHFNVRGREWQDKYFVSLEAWRIEKDGASGAAPSAPADSRDTFNEVPGNDAPLPEAGKEDDLPF